MTKSSCQPFGGANEPGFQMGSSPAGSPFWSADVPETDWSVIWFWWLTLVRTPQKTNYLDTVKLWLDTLNDLKRRRTWLRFFFSLIHVSFICILPLFLAETQNALHFPSWLAWLVSSHCCVRLWQEIKCKQQAHLLLWGTEIWSQVATRDEYKCHMEKTCLWEVSIHLGQLLKPGQNRVEQAQHSLHTKTRWRFAT